MKTNGDMRAQYRRGDFAKLERGKFHKRVAEGASFMLPDAERTKSSPTSEPVNDSLVQWRAC